MSRSATAFALALAVALGAPPARGATVGDGVLTVSGSGGWAYGKTSANDYLHGAPAGRWDNATFALAVIAQPDDRLQVAAQAFFVSRPTPGHEESVELDWAFATWRFSDALALRLGKVRQPFGLYGEIVDVGTLRPFLSLPQGIYGSGGFMSESYEGVGLTGDVRLRGRWSVTYDVYLGQVSTFETHVAQEVAHPELLLVMRGADEGIHQHGDEAGLRVMFRTPLEGLSFGLTAAGRPGGRRVAGVSAEWLRDALTLRSEAFYVEDEEDFSRAGYAEVARRFGRVEVAARLDLSYTHPRGYRGSSSVMHHRDLGLGAGWWFSPQLVVRAALHAVYGNRFAYPVEDFDRAVLEGTLEPRTLLFEAGAQFAF